MIKTKKQMFIIIGAFALVMLLCTVTYAFFNYTRTGQENTIRTGRIAFNAEQSPAVTLSDLFPITLGENETVTSSTPGVGVLTVHVTGDTDYGEGVEYIVKAVDVTGTNNISLPISISIGYEASTGEGKTIGTNDEEYFTNRGGATSRYKVLTTNTISEGQDLVVGYIAPGNTGIDGNIIIMAYLDARNIAITDTYDESDPETDYNGTTTNWVGERTVLTTNEWNEFQSSGTSFKIKVEAREGTWVVDSNAPICNRVTNLTSLHTEKCTNSDASSYCQGDGYSLNDDITYGNAKALGSTLAVGDAFDCKVSSSGDYTERFYYVSPYYDTYTQTFDNSYATLVYYSNTVGGVASTGGSPYYSLMENWHGPVIAKNNLPTTNQWNNIELKSTSRTILAEYTSIHNSLTTNNGNNEIDNPFLYTGYAARLLTAQEVMNGCGLTQVGSNTKGELSNCQFLFEGTSYSDSTRPTYGPWLENPNSSTYYSALALYAKNISTGYDYAQVDYVGARPAIDVPYSKLNY